MTTFATDEEIRSAHDILLAGQPDFEDDKLVVIRSNESRDIVACPGSGKTTVLLAKLSILSNRMPFADGSGICVLTHTNVAIDEIKARFGGKADLLFCYPNFCGTIQSFVDKFLTIPWYNSFAPHSLVAIDDERAISIIKKAFYNTSWDDQKSLNHLFYGNNEYKKMCEEKRWNDIRSMKNEFVYNTYMDVLHNKYYKRYGDKTPVASFNVKKASPTYSFLENVRQSAYSKGILKYEDAYSVALAYHEMIPGITESLSKRFKYLFIDEVQDSSQLQLNLLNKVFDREKIVVQRFGDPYQSIYNTDGDCAWIPINPLHLNNSKRFGISIAKVLRSVCVEYNKELNGNESVHSVKPVMIVYTDGGKVLSNFSAMLYEKKINDIPIADIAKTERDADPLHRINVKAVGFVGKVKESEGEIQSIHYYYPQFENQINPRHPYEESNTLDIFLRKNAIIDNPQEYRNHILDALAALLAKSDVKNNSGRLYSKTSMLNYLEESAPEIFNKLKVKLAEWVLKICNSEYVVSSTVFDDVKLFILSDFAKVFSINIKGESVKLFLEKKDDIYYSRKNVEQGANIYKDRGLEIEVATVHSVKGETHAATLFLETRYYRYESEHFGSQLCGDPYDHREGEGHILPSLKVAYVALSRPKYLLAYAIHKDRFDKLDRNKLERNWEIRQIE